MRVDVCRRIAEVGRERWRQLLDAGSLYLSYEWLSSVEGSLAPESYYVTAWEGDRLLAAIPAYLIADPKTYAFYNPAELVLAEATVETLAPYLDDRPRAAYRALRSALVSRRADLYPSLVCASPYGYLAWLCHRPGLPPALLDQVRRSLLDEVAALAARLHAPCRAFLYVPDGKDPALERALRTTGYQAAALSGECTLDVTWPSFDAYLDTRPGHRRREFRREIARFQDTGHAIRIGDASALDRRLADLQAQLSRKYGGRGDPDRIELGFRRATAHLGPFIRPFTVFKAAEPVGFALFYQRDNQLYCKQAGFDYAREGAYRYFNVIFYEPIRYAIREGVHTIQYGSESYEAKLRRGCGLELRTGYFALDREPLRADLFAMLALHDAAQRRRLQAARERYSG